MSHPMSMVPATDMMVNVMPSAPDASDACRFMPKPSAMTEYCRSDFDAFLLNAGNALPQRSANASPRNSASGGVTGV